MIKIWSTETALRATQTGHGILIRAPLAAVGVCTSAAWRLWSPFGLFAVLYKHERPPLNRNTLCHFLPSKIIQQEFWSNISHKTTLTQRCLVSLHNLLSSKCFPNILGPDTDNCFHYNNSVLLWWTGFSAQQSLLRSVRPEFCPWTKVLLWSCGSKASSHRLTDAVTLHRWSQILMLEFSFWCLANLSQSDQEVSSREHSAIHTHDLHVLPNHNPASVFVWWSWTLADTRGLQIFSWNELLFDLPGVIFISITVEFNPSGRISWCCVYFTKRGLKVEFYGACFNSCRF